MEALPGERRQQDCGYGMGQSKGKNLEGGGLREKKLMLSRGLGNQTG